jgi:hypothetical protein
MIPKLKMIPPTNIKNFGPRVGWSFPPMIIAKGIIKSEMENARDVSLVDQWKRLIRGR